MSASLALAISYPLLKPAIAKRKRNGCWLRPAGGNLSNVVKNPQRSSGDARIDLFCSYEADRLNTAFSVKPLLLFFDDSGSPNALATPEVSERSRPDGTVLIGITLAQNAFRSSRNEPLELAAVMAHEWAHIVQFKQKFASDWGVHFELNADSAAGWYLASTRPRRMLLANATKIGQYFASLGSTSFNNFESHGSPRQRTAEILSSAGLAQCESCGNAGYTYPAEGPLEALRLR